MRDKVLELINSYISKAIKNSSLDTAQAFDAFRDEFLVIYSQQTLKPITEPLGFIPENEHHVKSVNDMLKFLMLRKTEVFTLTALDIKDKFPPGSQVFPPSIAECINHIYPKISDYIVGTKPPRPGSMALAGVFCDWVEKNEYTAGLEKVGHNTLRVPTIPKRYELDRHERNGVTSLLKSLA